jgi:hypothetical protein
VGLMDFCVVPADSNCKVAHEACEVGCFTASQLQESSRKSLESAQPASEVAVARSDHAGKQEAETEIPTELHPYTVLCSPTEQRRESGCWRC